MRNGPKLVIGIIICFVALFVVLRLLKSTGIAVLYQVPTTSNAPYMEPGDYIFISKWAPLEKNKFISYTRKDSILGYLKFIHRLVASPGDTLEIKGSIVYVNGINIDKEFQLKHMYSVDATMKPEILSIRPDLELDGYRVSTSEYWVHLTSETANQLSSQPNLKITPKEQGSEQLNNQFDARWNFDHFGPIIMPKGKYFVLGDNRHNSRDSRVTGYVDNTDIIGVLILKF